MFEPADGPRCFALPVGCDFSRLFLDGLAARLRGRPPEAMARVTIFVNTRRTQRRLHDLLLARAPGFLPRIRTIPDLAHDPLPQATIPPAVPPLRRQLELSRAIFALLQAEPDLAPRSAAFDLAESLAGLMDEMQGEGVDPAKLRMLDMGDHAAHWQRSLKFLDILAPCFADRSAPDTEARQRMVVEYLARRWRENPPEHPVIVAGSTGSRGATALFMRAVAKLPQGAVVLPGFDFDMPENVCALLSDPETGAEHPQAGLIRFLDSIGMPPGELPLWHSCDTSSSSRNKLISLALRPAPATDYWLREGPALGDLTPAVQELSLLEADSPRQEALAIALCLRAALEEGRKAALITPDRALGRQVTAALDRWRILPDDSAGHPLALTPPGIFLTLTAALAESGADTGALAALLKHPLTHSGSPGRGEHLLRSRALELGTREHPRARLRGGPPEPDFAAIAAWAATREDDPGARAWAAWLTACFTAPGPEGPRPLADHIARHLKRAERLAAGPAPEGDNPLWQKAAGEAARALFADLERSADACGAITTAEYMALLRNLMHRTEIRDPPPTAHPRITIWGTLEARVQGADLVILGSLNEGSWPKLPDPDPWLSRSMRAALGLPPPERRIGLAAHDFQQAAGAPRVLFSRAIRDADSPTVASRWLTRLTHLLSGLGERGTEALAGMRARGQRWRDLAMAMEDPAPRARAPRPSPRPPVAHRPRKLSVTRINTLIRDPYSIYARDILRLHPLDPLHPRADALLRGQALHLVMEEFIRATKESMPENAAERLLEIAAEVLEREIPWPATRRLWLARLARIADSLVADEMRRRRHSTPLALEVAGAREIAGLRFTLTAKADRIDRMGAGLAIRDYKSGALPTPAQVKAFDKQLPLEAAIAEAGGFDGIAPMPVLALEYIGLGAGAPVRDIDLSDGLIGRTWQELQGLLASWQRPGTGYTARMRMEKDAHGSDYDHLSRYGEWDESDTPTGEDVG